MAAPQLVRGTSHGVTLLGDPCRPGGVTLAFTERGGGVSAGPHASLNLGDACGDDARLVAENRRRACEAIGASAAALVCPRQVHGTDVLVVGGSGLVPADAAQAARDGYDAVVCTEPDVPVLLCFADCVPVVLAAPGAFAVVHSGWRGTLARIAAKALAVLVREAACAPDEVCAYVGPHIGPADFEVSAELAARFSAEFGSGVLAGERHLDLGAAVAQALAEAGLPAGRLACVGESTATHADRFFSYRGQGGTCGRHGALAVLATDDARRDAPRGTAPPGRMR